MERDNSYDLLFKLLLVGDSGVGKTSILFSFCEEGSFNSSFTPTFGIDFKIKTIECRGKRIKLQFWDTAGQERFQSVVSCYYRGARGVLLVYDITDLRSFESLGRWLRAVEELASPGVLRQAAATSGATDIDPSLTRVLIMAKTIVKQKKTMHSLQFYL